VAACRSGRDGLRHALRAPKQLRALLQRIVPNRLHPADAVLGSWIGAASSAKASSSTRRRGSSPSGDTNGEPRRRTLENRAAKRLRSQMAHLRAQAA